jgi:RNA-binding protein 16
MLLRYFQSKVIRVLNLWQKNEVFPSEVIQPLFDLANPNSDLAKQMDDQVSNVIKRFFSHCGKVS